MKNTLASPERSLLLGLLIALVVLVFWALSARTDMFGMSAFAVRWLHIVSAVIWIGMIWFVNFIQLVAIAEADSAGKSAILKHIVPRVALTFRQASHVVVITGALLLVTSGYVASAAIFQAPYAVPFARNVVLWGGVLAAMAMYMFVHMMIWPGLRKVLGIDQASAEEIAAARAKVAVYARWNLILAVPVTVAMVAAGHL